MKKPIVLLCLLFAILPSYAQAAHSVDVKWTASVTTGVTGYNVKRATVSGGPYTTINTAPVGGLIFTDSSSAVQNEGSTLFYVVTAIGPGGESGPSNQATAPITFSQTAPPSGVTTVVH